MDTDNFLPNNFQDPFDRLNDIEQELYKHNHYLENLSDQIKTNSNLLVQISDHMSQLAQMNMGLHKQNQALHHRLKILEGRFKDANKD